MANSGAQFTHAENLPPNFSDAAPINSQQFLCAAEMREWSGWVIFKAVLSRGLSLGTWITYSPTIAVSKYCPVWDWTHCLVALSPGRGPEMLISNNVTSLMYGYKNWSLKVAYFDLQNGIKINYPFIHFTLLYLVGMCICAYLAQYMYKLKKEQNFQVSVLSFHHVNSSLWCWIFRCLHPLSHLAHPSFLHYCNENRAQVCFPLPEFPQILTDISNADLDSLQSADNRPGPLPHS